MGALIQANKEKRFRSSTRKPGIFFFFWRGGRGVEVGKGIHEKEPLIHKILVACWNKYGNYIIRCILLAQWPDL